MDMRTITLYDGGQLPVMGLGTWTIGGHSRPDPSQDERGLRALAAAFAIGYTHIDTAEMYANGHTEELIGQALRRKDRQRYFLTTKVRPPNLGYRRTLESIDGSLRRLDVEQIDLSQVKRIDFEIISYLKESHPDLYRSLRRAARSRHRPPGATGPEPGEVDEDLEAALPQEPAAPRP